MSKDVYTRLREFMDTLPAGFPATPTGVEIKILKKALYAGAGGACHEAGQGSGRG